MMICYRCHSHLEGMPSRCPFCTSDINPWSGGPPDDNAEPGFGSWVVLFLISVATTVYTHWEDTVVGWIDTLMQLLGLS